MNRPNHPTVRGIGFAVLAIIALASVTSAFAQSAEPIVIGAVLSLTGRDAAFGQESLAGLDIAIEEANADGGVQNRQIKLQVYDDQSDPILAAEGVRTLVKRHNPVAIIGSNTSMVTSAAAVAAQAVGVPLIVPEATKPEISSIGDWIYRVCFLDPDMAAGLASFAYDELGLRRIAIFTEEKHDYTLSFARYFQGRFTEMGGEIVCHLMYPPGMTAFGPAVDQAANAKAEAILVSGFYLEAGNVIASSKKNGLNFAFLGGDGWESDGLFTAAGDAVTDRSKIYIASHFSVDVKRMKVRGFVQAFEEKFGRRPNTSSALGFDATGLVVEALSRAGDISPQSLKAALPNMHHEGVTGHITINDSRNAAKKVIIMQARPDRHFAYVRAISPESLATTTPTQ